MKARYVGFQRGLWVIEIASPAKTLSLSDPKMMAGAAAALRLMGVELAPPLSTLASEAQLEWDKRTYDTWSAYLLTTGTRGPDWSKPVIKEGATGTQ